jgi:hypothetical protein
MFLACVELANRNGFRSAIERGRVLQLQFNLLETAKVWAEEESSRRRDATGNAAVFEAMGPYLSLAWERVTDEFNSDHESPDFAADQLAERA